VLICVVNVSEGRRVDVVSALADAAGPDLLDVHHDADHNRCVLTLVGEEAVRAVSRRAVERLDLRGHTGAHPRMGVVDVVPFVPLGPASLADAARARDRFSRWLGEELDVPSFAYGHRSGSGSGPLSLPEVRRRAFVDLEPVAGPATPHPSAGATAVGARGVLVAYNLWLASGDVALARTLARSLRSPAVRALGLVVGDAVQVSCNLLDPVVVGPAAVYDAVAARTPVVRTELVGLAPAAVVAGVPAERWAELDLSPGRTFESRLARWAARTAR
jgi:glutamate formiminotransferase